VVALYKKPKLLVYRFQVSRVNKLVLMLGAFNIYLLISRRLSAEGRICSGEHLSMEDWWANYHPQVSENYLIKMGFVLKMYAYVCSTLFVFLSLAVLYLGYSVKNCILS
jgi:hypothetical protein